MKKKWSEDEINFLKKNYPTMGSKFCAESLGRSVQSITIRSHILKLKSEVKYQKIVETKLMNNLNKFDVSELINPSTIEASYILGLLWADGNISNFGFKTVRLNCVVEDMDYFKQVFTGTSRDWVLTNEFVKYYNGHEVKKQQTIKMSSVMLYDFLYKNDYDEKSFLSADKILKIIPYELNKFFILGLFDGDGHFNVVKKTKQAEWVITSSYDQDWHFMEDFCQKNGIEYSIYRLVVPLGRVSNFIVRKLDSINKIINLVHSHKIGLPRKKNKINIFLGLRNNKIKSKIIKWSEEELSFLIKNYGSDIIYTHLNRTKHSIMWKINQLKIKGFITPQ
jgi:hypothetical protein